MDCSPPGSSVQEILQARILEWFAMPFSRGSSWPRDRTCISWSPALAGRFFTTDATWEAPGLIHLLSSFWNFVAVVSFLVIFGLIHVCIKKSVKKNHLYCFDGLFRISKGLSAFIEFNYFYLGIPWTLFYSLYDDFYEVMRVSLHWLLRIKYRWLEMEFREGSGTPLQYSCLENPVDGGAW